MTSLLRASHGDRDAKSITILLCAVFFVTWLMSHILIIAIGNGDLESIRKVLLLVGGAGIVSLAFLQMRVALLMLFIGWTLLPTTWFPLLTVNGGIGYVSAFSVLILSAFIAGRMTPISKNVSTSWDWTDIFLLAFLSWALLGMLVSETALKVFVSTIEFGCWSWVVFRLARGVTVSDRGLRLVTFVIVGMGVLVSSLGVVESLFLGSPLLLEMPTSQIPEYLFQHGLPQRWPMRAISTIGNPLSMGVYLTMALPFTVLLLFETEQWKGRLAAWILIGTVAGGILVTFSRTALAVMLGELLFMALFFPRGKKRGRSLLVVPALLGMMGLLLVPNPVRDRFVERFSRESLLGTDFYHRVYSIESSWNMVRESPLLGFGLGTTFGEHYERFQAAGTESSFTFDNWYLALPAMTGLPGLVFFLGAVGFVVWRLRPTIWRGRSDFKAKFLACVFLALLSMLAGGLTMDVFLWDNLSQTFWLIAGMGIGTAAAGQEIRV